MSQKDKLGTGSKVADAAIDEIFKGKQEYDSAIHSQKYSMVDLWGTMGVVSAMYFVILAVFGANGAVWASIILTILGIGGYKLQKRK